MTPQELRDQGRIAGFYDRHLDEIGTPSEISSMYAGAMFNHNGIFATLPPPVGNRKDTIQAVFQAGFRQVEALMDALGSGNGDLVLDDGCGAGGSALYAASTYFCDVVGVTLSHRQALVGSISAWHAIADDAVSFYQANALRLPYKDGVFDGVIMSEMTEHVRELPPVYEEAYRVAKEGSRLVTSAWSWNPDHPDGAFHRMRANAAYELLLHTQEAYLTQPQSVGWKLAETQDHTASAAAYWQLRSAIGTRVSEDERLLGDGFASGALSYTIYVYEKHVSP